MTNTSKKVTKICPKCKKGYLKLTSFLNHLFTEEKTLKCNKCRYEENNS